MSWWVEGGGSYSVFLPQQKAEEEQEVETLSDQGRLVNVFLRLLLLQERLQVVVVETEEETFNYFNRHLSQTFLRIQERELRIIPK